jgi:hypothetical protein
MQNKKMIGLIIGFVILAGVSFYTGSMYANAKNKTQTTQSGNDFAMRNGIGNGAQRGLRAGGGNVFGQIISKDANSITVQLNVPSGPNGTGETTASTGTGSKIVLYTSTTNVLKTTAGTINDLVVGTNVSIQGTTNTDGSVSAQSISIRPLQQNTTK